MILKSKRTSGRDSRFEIISSQFASAFDRWDIPIQDDTQADSTWWSNQGESTRMIDRRKTSRADVSPRPSSDSCYLIEVTCSFLRMFSFPWIGNEHPRLNVEWPRWHFMSIARKCKLMIDWFNATMLSTLRYTDTRACVTKQSDNADNHHETIQGCLWSRGYLDRALSREKFFIEVTERS